MQLNSVIVLGCTLNSCCAPLPFEFVSSFSFPGNYWTNLPDACAIRMTLQDVRNLHKVLLQVELPCPLRIFYVAIR